ncbi:MAG: TonB-dependent receptor [Sphingomicrobium sp.]
MQALPPQQVEQAIVVTGRALARPSSEQVLQSDVLTAKELRNAPSARLDRLLDRFAGVQLFRRSDARSAHPTSQGVTLRALGGNAASRAQLILDGVPQSDPFGGWIEWPSFDVADLAEVRVTRGGGSFVNGPGALGGTIELASAADPGIAAELDGGSRNSIEGHLSARQHVGSGIAALAVQASQGSGFIPVAERWRGSADQPAPYRNASGRFRWIKPISGATELQANLSIFGDQRERGLRFTSDRSRGSDLSVRLVSRGRWAWSILGYGQLRNFRSSFAAVDAQRTQARRTALQYDVPGRSAGWSAEVRPPAGPGIELRIGADGRSMRGESREYSNYAAGAPRRDRRSGGSSGYGGLFAEVSSDRGPLLLTGSGRIDRWRISDGELLERALATGSVLTNAQYPARSGWRPTGRLAAALTLAPELSGRGAAYLAWRLPTLNELFRPFRAGSDATAANAELRPERLRGVEAGLNWKPGDFDFAVTAFANTLADAISNVTLGTGPGTFPGVGFVAAGGAYRQRQNIGAINVHGLEASAQWRRGPWKALLSSSLANAKVRGSGASASLNGLRPAQTPRFASSASVGWDNERRSATIVLHYEGARFEDDLNRQRLPSALTFDGFAGLPLARGWAVVARAENVFDARVAAGVSGGGVIERATPRTLWLGLKFSHRA